MKMPWVDFIKALETSDIQYELRYKDEIIVIRSGNSFSYVIVEKFGKIVYKKRYTNIQELISTCKVNGMTLEEAWDDLIFA